MRGMEREIERVMHKPQFVRRSRSDEAVRLFYVFYAQTLVVGGKWLCVVVKYVTNDAFVITAYLTDKPKAGENLLAEKVKVWFDAEADLPRSPVPRGGGLHEGKRPRRRDGTGRYAR